MNEELNNYDLQIINAFSSYYIEYKSNGDKDKLLSIKEYLNMIKPYLTGIKMIIKLKENGKFILKWKLSFFLQYKLILYTVRVTT